MNDQELLRYSRHIMLPQVDIDGQGRLLGAHALIIGVGGLGSPAALYLAASGVGRLTLVDDDVVELTNLQRQIAHTEAALGETKVASACARAKALNGQCVIETVQARPDAARLSELVRAADVVLDCTDRFSSRYAINRACLETDTPLVSGAAIRFSGQLAVFDFRTRETHCYACLYGDDGSDEALSCAESGVISPLVGVIGTFQALEAVKLLAGAGTSAKGLSSFDGLTGEWRQFDVQRDPECPVCAAHRPA
ncbi:HesA/MoeB/ThiF family protein [Larsenimonas salina]|uniref:HesA/MoeB/ThiF family protein n=1 Tax=Larsenimonas salina TaxID=1295565 RepID=UPI002073F9A8|nr:molybdopterin-synthase adenylyltransferase MoeB [Larsenimonas salina]MCM5703080.1 molybdopterin-synthase adenylyltransferase MoeB [Larsenimonas salina]